MKATKEYATKTLNILKKEFPNAKCALNYQNNWQLLVATILSAQSTDDRVNMVTVELFEKYPHVEDMATADIEDIKRIIKSVGVFNQKAKYLKGSALKVLENFNGIVPNTMKDLIMLPGVARKTANVVLGVGFNINEGIAVDTHVRRLSNRLHLSKSDTAEKIEKDLMPLFKQENWERVNALFIQHGRKTCTARSPQCKNCPLRDICPSAKFFLSKKQV